MGVGRIGGVYKPDAGGGEPLAIPTSSPHFIYGETDARKKNMIYSGCDLFKVMLRLELVFPWRVLFLGSKSTQHIVSVSDWHDSMKSEGPGF